MIDIKLLRENPDLIRASQTGRGEDAGIVDQVLALDEKRRAAINEFEALRAEQNTLSKAVGSAKGDEKAALLENAKDLANKVKAADSKRAEIEVEANNEALKLSNILDPAAPIGGEADFVIIEHVGTPREFSDFEPKDLIPCDAKSLFWAAIAPADGPGIFGLGLGGGGDSSLPSSFGISGFSGIDGGTPPFIFPLSKPSCNFFITDSYQKTSIKSLSGVLLGIFINAFNIKSISFLL